MASSATGAARGSLYRQYSRGSNGGGSSSSIENLPPRTLARVAREVRDLVKNAPEGVSLVVDNETGLPANLGEVVVSLIGFLRMLFWTINYTPVPFVLPSDQRVDNSRWVGQSVRVYCLCRIQRRFCMLVCA